MNNSMVIPIMFIFIVSAEKEHREYLIRKKLREMKVKIFNLNWKGK